jgi:hypothetical protein
MNTYPQQNFCVFGMSVMTSDGRTLVSLPTSAVCIWLLTCIQDVPGWGLDRDTTVLTSVFRGFTQFLQANVSHCRFLPHAFRVIIDHNRIIRRYILIKLETVSLKSRVEAGSNPTTVARRVVGGDEKGSLESETLKYGGESHGSRARE